MPQDPYTEIAKPEGDPYATIAHGPPSMSTIGVNRGPQTSSPGYRYSTGYQGEGDAPRDSGGFIDRALTTFGRDLSDPSSFLPSWKSLFPPIQALDQAKQEWDAYRHPEAPQEDPARAIGHLGVPALAAAVTHAGDAVPNIGEAAGSDLVPSGVAHPIEGLGRAVKAIPRPDLMTVVRDPLRAAVRPITAIPDIARAGLGENIRIRPVARPEPAWKTANTEGTSVPSILNRQPYAEVRPRVAAPGAVARPEPEAILLATPPSIQSPPPDAFVSRIARQEAERSARTGVPIQTEEETPPMSQRAIDAWQESAFGKKPENLDIGTKVRNANPEPPRATTRVAKSSTTPNLSAKLAQAMEDIQNAPPAESPAEGRPLIIDGKVVDPTQDLTAGLKKSLRRVARPSKTVQ